MKMYKIFCVILSKDKYYLVSEKRLNPNDIIVKRGPWDSCFKYIQSRKAEMNSTVVYYNPTIAEWKIWYFNK